MSQQREPGERGRVAGCVTVSEKKKEGGKGIGVRDRLKSVRMKNTLKMSALIGNIGTFDESVERHRTF